MTIQQPLLKLLLVVKRCKIFLYITIYMSDIHSVYFMADEWEPAGARRWLKKHNLKPSKGLRREGNQLRYNIIPKEEFDHFTTKITKDGVHIVIGWYEPYGGEFCGDDDSSDEEGGNIFTDAYQSVFGRLQNRPKSINEMLKKYGDKYVVAVDICRAPLMSAFRSLLGFVNKNLVSVMKKYNYDDIFHLFSNIYLNDGTKIGLEKNQRVNIKIGGWDQRGKCLRHEVKIPFTLKSMIDKGEVLGNSYGSFWRYSPDTDNCQKFINDLMTASGINGFTDFIQQETQEILPPSLFRDIAKGITDFAGIGDYLLRGGKVEYV